MFLCSCFVRLCSCCVWDWCICFCIHAMLSCSTVPIRQMLTFWSSCRIGKLMVLGAIFRCLDSALTLAASLSFKTPFVSAVWWLRHSWVLMYGELTCREACCIMENHLLGLMLFKWETYPVIHAVLWIQFLWVVVCNGGTCHKSFCVVDKYWESWCAVDVYHVSWCVFKMYSF